MRRSTRQVRASGHPDARTEPDAIVAELAAAGVREVFGIARRTVSPMIDAIGRHGGFRWTAVHHESAAVYMATAVAHRGRRPSACVLELRSATRARAAMQVATRHRLPVVVVTRGGVTMLSGGDGATPVGLGGRTLAAAVSGTDEPRAREGLVPGWADPVGPESTVAPADLERVAWMLAAARRPLLLIGGEVVCSGAHSQVRALVRRLGAAALLTPQSVGVLGGEDPCLVGIDAPRSALSMRALASADVVAMIGGDLPAADAPGLAAIGSCRVVIRRRLSELDGRDRATLRLSGDIRTTLAGVLRRLPPRGRADSFWRRRLRDDYLASQRTAALDLVRSSPRAVTLADVDAALAGWVPADMLRVGDDGRLRGGDGRDPPEDPRLRLTGLTTADAGFRVCDAHAVALLAPGRAVLDVVGPAGLDSHLAELGTAVRHCLHVVHIVHDKADPARQPHRPDGDRDPVHHRDYAVVARALGAHGDRVTSVDELRPALARALAHRGPSVVDVRAPGGPSPRRRRRRRPVGDLAEQTDRATPLRGNVVRIGRQAADEPHSDAHSTLG